MPAWPAHCWAGPQPLPHTPTNNTCSRLLYLQKKTLQARQTLYSTFLTHLLLLILLLLTAADSVGDLLLQEMEQLYLQSCKNSSQTRRQQVSQLLY